MLSLHITNEYVLSPYYAVSVAVEMQRCRKQGPRPQEIYGVLRRKAMTSQIKTREVNEKTQHSHN